MISPLGEGDARVQSSEWHSLGNWPESCVLPTPYSSIVRLCSLSGLCCSMGPGPPVRGLSHLLTRDIYTYIGIYNCASPSTAHATRSKLVTFLLWGTTFTFCKVGLWLWAHIHPICPPNVQHWLITEERKSTHPGSYPKCIPCLVLRTPPGSWVCKCSRSAGWMRCGHPARGQGWKKDSWVRPSGLYPCCFKRQHNRNRHQRRSLLTSIHMTKMK